jgi:putative addiction module component (TIGR02574 family)
MTLDRFPEIRELSAAERSQLMNELSELTLAELESDPRFIAELERRMEEYRRDPTTGSTWPEVQQRLRAKFPRP